MPFTDVSAPVVAKVGTGITFSLSVGKRSSFCRLIFNQASQMEIFERSIFEVRFAARVGRGVDVGKLLLLEQGDGDLVATKSFHGSAAIKMASWDLLPKGKVPSGSVYLLGPEMGGLMFQLPSWSKPSGVGGKIEKEHGLKTIAS